MAVCFFSTRPHFPLFLLGMALRLQQANPKRPGTASYERYEHYKSATSLEEFLKFGGSRGDYKHDKGKGFLVDEGAPASLGVKRAAADVETEHIDKKVAHPHKGKGKKATERSTAKEAVQKPAAEQYIFLL